MRISISSGTKLTTASGEVYTIVGVPSRTQLVVTQAWWAFLHLFWLRVASGVTRLWNALRRAPKALPASSEESFDVLVTPDDADEDRVSGIRDVRR